MLLHWITQPGMQAWVCSPPRETLSWLMYSPPILNFSPLETSTCWPALKLLTGRPPRVFWRSAMPMVPTLA